MAREHAQGRLKCMLNMKNIITIVLLFLFSAMVSGQNTNSDAAQIRQKIARVRQSTNWNDPAAAKEANRQIQELSKQLIKAGNQSSSGQSASSNNYDEEKKDTEESQINFTSQIIDNINSSADSDTISLAKPFRDKIVEAYKDDESPIVKSKEFLNESTVLVIDMSLPTVRRTIEQMKSYKSIKTLIITGGKDGAPVNLTDLLIRASAYPLENLYIINFRQYVTSIPPQVTLFRKLSTLALFNNDIHKLPDMSANGASIDSLFIDMNPINTLYPSLNSMSGLKKLGIVKTSVTEDEVTRIKKQLPECQILIK